MIEHETPRHRHTRRDRRRARRVSRRTALLTSVLVVALVAATAVVVDTSPPAEAFGTVELGLLKQKVVHEPITRTLSCVADQTVAECWQPQSINQLAGKGGTFGAVGEPDNPLDGSPNPAARHCDNVDSGYGSYNTQADAQKAFDECLDWYQSYMQFAVDSAAALLKPDGTIDAPQTDILNATGSTYNACRLPDPKKNNTSNDSAKCNVINGFGRALHLYEDFWSHSNWADKANPKTPESLTNPVGLSNTDQPDFFAFPGPSALSLPERLLTGCDDSISKLDCALAEADPNVPGSFIITQFRTAHSMVNKDNGNVDAKTCRASDPITDRGKVTVDGTANFQRAVTGACGAARRAWTDLQNQLVAVYGPERAATMIRAITKDTPLTECKVGGGAARALRPPVGDVSSSRSVEVKVANQTGEALTCGDVTLDGGEWASYPPDTIQPDQVARWRTQSNGFMTGTEGRATFTIGASQATVKLWWNNPYVGSNGYSCTASAGYKCSRDGGSGNDSSVTFTVRKA